MLTLHRVQDPRGPLTLPTPRTRLTRGFCLLDSWTNRFSPHDKEITVCRSKSCPDYYRCPGCRSGGSHAQAAKRDYTRYRRDVAEVLRLSGASEEQVAAARKLNKTTMALVVRELGVNPNVLSDSPAPQPSKRHTISAQQQALMDTIVGGDGFTIDPESLPKIDTPVEELSAARAAAHAPADDPAAVAAAATAALETQRHDYEDRGEFAAADHLADEADTFDRALDAMDTVEVAYTADATPESLIQAISTRAGIDPKSPNAAQYTVDALRSAEVAAETFGDMTTAADMQALRYRVEAHAANTPRAERARELASGGDPDQEQGDVTVTPIQPTPLTDADLDDLRARTSRAIDPDEVDGLVTAANRGEVFDELYDTSQRLTGAVRSASVTDDVDAQDAVAEAMSDFRARVRTMQASAIGEEDMCLSTGSVSLEGIESVDTPADQIAAAVESQDDETAAHQLAAAKFEQLRQAHTGITAAIDYAAAHGQDTVRIGGKDVDLDEARQMAHQIRDTAREIAPLSTFQERAQARATMDPFAEATAALTVPVDEVATTALLPAHRTTYSPESADMLTDPRNPYKGVRMDELFGDDPARCVHQLAREIGVSEDVSEQVEFVTGDTVPATTEDVPPRQSAAAAVKMARMSTQLADQAKQLSDYADNYDTAPEDIRNRYSAEELSELARQARTAAELSSEYAAGYAAGALADPDHISYAPVHDPEDLVALAATGRVGRYDMTSSAAGLDANVSAEIRRAAAQPVSGSLVPGWKQTYGFSSEALGVSLDGSGAVGDRSLMSTETMRELFDPSAELSGGFTGRELITSPQVIGDVDPDDAEVRGEQVDTYLASLRRTSRAVRQARSLSEQLDQIAADPEFPPQGFAVPATTVDGHAAVRYVQPDEIRQVADRLRKDADKGQRGLADAVGALREQLSNDDLDKAARRHEGTGGADALLAARFWSKPNPEATTRMLAREPYVPGNRVGGLSDELKDMAIARAAREDTEDLFTVDTLRGAGARDKLEAAAATVYGTQGMVFDVAGVSAESTPDAVDNRLRAVAARDIDSGDDALDAAVYAASQRDCCAEVARRMAVVAQGLEDESKRTGRDTRIPAPVGVDAPNGWSAADYANAAGQWNQAASIAANYHDELRELYADEHSGTDEIITARQIAEKADAFRRADRTLAVVAASQSDAAPADVLPLTVDNDAVNQRGAEYAEKARAATREVEAGVESGTVTPQALRAYAALVSSERGLARVDRTRRARGMDTGAGTGEHTDAPQRQLAARAAFDELAVRHVADGLKEDSDTAAHAFASLSRAGSGDDTQRVPLPEVGTVAAAAAAEKSRAVQQEMEQAAVYAARTGDFSRVLKARDNAAAVVREMNDTSQNLTVASGALESTSNPLPREVVSPQALRDHAATVAARSAYVQSLVDAVPSTPAEVGSDLPWQRDYDKRQVIARLAPSVVAANDDQTRGDVMRTLYRHAEDAQSQMFADFSTDRAASAEQLHTLVSSWGEKFAQSYDDHAKDAFEDAVSYYDSPSAGMNRVAAAGAGSMDATPAGFIASAVCHGARVSDPGMATVARENLRSIGRRYPSEVTGRADAIMQRFDAALADYRPQGLDDPSAARYRSSDLAAMVERMETLRGQVRTRPDHLVEMEVLSRMAEAVSEASIGETDYYGGVGVSSAPAAGVSYAPSDMDALF